MRTAWISAIAMFCWPLLAAAAGLQPDAAAMSAARSEIAAMGEPELRSLLSYLADCADRLSPSQAVQQTCRSAVIKYRTEFGAKRTIDTVIAEQEELGKIQRAFRATGQSTDSTYVEAVDRQLHQAVGDALKAKSGR